MKPRLLCTARLSFPLAVAALLAAPSAQAITYYWDNNGTATGFGSAGGTWQIGTVSQWSTGTGSTTGVATPGVSVTTTTSDALNFGQDTSPYGLGGGTITVSGTVNAASLRFGNQTTSNVVLSGGTINLAAVTSIHVGAGGTTVHTISSSITGAGTSLTKTGNALQLTGNNSYTGSTLISTGSLILGSTTAVASTSGITIGGAAAATLTSGSNMTGIDITAPITAANSGITSTIAFGRSTSAAGAYTLSGGITGGAGNVTFTTVTANSGGNLQTIILGGGVGSAGGYGGNTTLTTGSTGNAMTLRSGIANALPTTTVLTFAQNAGSGSGRTTTFDLFGNNQTLAGLSNTGLVPDDRNMRVTSATAATLTINNTSNFTFGGTTRDAASGTGSDGTVTSAQITGAISLVKNGAGTFTLGGTLTSSVNGSATAQGNSFTGTTKILGGILSLGQSTSIQNSAFDTTGSVAGNGTRGLHTTVTTLSMGGLTGDKNFVDVFTDATGGPSNTTANGGYDGLTSLTLNPGTGVTNSYAADVGNGSGGMILTKTTTGTQVFTVAQTYTGNTNVNGGILQLSGTGTLGSGTYNANISVATAATLQYSSTVNQTLGGIISGLGGITKDTGSASKLTLSGDNTYDGTTTVSAGTLLINGNSSTSIGAVNVTGGTLGGTGTTGGAITVAGGATLAPGASIESLVAPSLSMESTSVFAYEVADNSATGADLLALSGTLSLTDVTLSLDSFTQAALAGTWSLGNKLTLISYFDAGAGITSGFTGYADNTSYFFGANEWLFDYNDTVAGGNYETDVTIAGSNRFVTLTAVPEPGAALLGGLGLLALLRRRR